MTKLEKTERNLEVFFNDYKERITDDIIIWGIITDILTSGKRVKKINKKNVYSYLKQHFSMTLNYRKGIFVKINNFLLTTNLPAYIN